MGRWSSSSHSPLTVDWRRGARKPSLLARSARCAGRRRSTTCKAQRQGAASAWVNVEPIEQTGPGKDSRRGAEFAADGAASRATAPRAAVRPSTRAVPGSPAPSYIQHVPETKVRVCLVRSGALGWEWDGNSPFHDPRRATVTTHTAQNVVAPAPLVGPPGGGVRRPSNQPIDISRWSGRDFCRPIQPLPLHHTTPHHTTALRQPAAGSRQPCSERMPIAIAPQSQSRSAAHSAGSSATATCVPSPGP